MSRVVLDTNVVVSALLASSGTQATVLMLAFGGHDELRFRIGHGLPNGVFGLRRHPARKRSRRSGHSLTLVVPGERLSRKP